MQHVSRISGRLKDGPGGSALSQGRGKGCCDEWQRILTFRSRRGQKRDEKRADREKGPERSATMRFETAARVKIEQTESRA